MERLVVNVTLKGEVAILMVADATEMSDLTIVAVPREIAEEAMEILTSDESLAPLADADGEYLPEFATAPSLAAMIAKHHGWEVLACLAIEFINDGDWTRVDVAWQDFYGN